jgi:hypothetical protein
MASRREIARDWGVAKSYVDKCVTQRGCPTSSLGEARTWRDENARRRPPTDQKSLARVLAEEGDTDSPRASILIPLATAKDMAWRGYDEILDLVDRLPKTPRRNATLEIRRWLSLFSNLNARTSFAMHARRTPHGRKSGRISPLRQMQNDWFRVCCSYLH